MCSICNGYPGCPCCSDDNTFFEQKCEACNGEGFIFFDIEAEIQVPIDVYNKLPETQRTKETCFDCKGEGVINTQY